MSLQVFFAVALVSSGTHTEIPPHPVVQISAGFTHSCALTETGQAWCWGWNDSGQLGDGIGASTTVPVKVAGPRIFIDIAVSKSHGRFSCAVSEAREAWCWGENTHGQLGNGSKTKSISPVRVKNLPLVTKIAVGYSHACAIDLGGDAWCWGKGNYGQLGSGSTNDQADPVKVQDIHNLVKISTGGQHTCAVAQNGLGYCWGYGGVGQLGTGKAPRIQSKPQQVANLTKIVDISAGQDHTCAFEKTGSKNNGIAWCWGFGKAGQRGDGHVGTSREGVTRPVQVKYLTRVSAISANGGHTCAASANGKAYCWGMGKYGQRGDGTVEPQSGVPVQVKNVSDMVGVSAGQHHSCGFNVIGQAFCWGNNSRGQMGNGTADANNHTTPHKVKFPKKPNE